ncbi:MAG: HAMP domain-containing histidine kinase [Phycisphaerae bacterium]|nr:HAMP domain-containing histidine kinase [Phycisphaerae bacterium]
MYTARQIEKDIDDLREEALTRDIVIPLLQEMGYKDVRYVHGMFEHGVDVLCTEETPFGSEFCGLQVKAVPISASKRAKGGNVSELINQASSALRHRFIDERDNTEKSLDKYFILTSAKISDASVAEIRDALEQFGRTIRFIDGHSLTRHVQEHLQSYVIDYFARRDMVAEFGHILRTPLQGIAGDLDWLRSLLSRGDTGNKALLACDRAGSHIQDISRKIRSYVQAIAPPKTLGMTFRQVDVDGLAHTVVHGFSAGAEMRGIRLEIKSERVPPIITDPDALELVLANLVDNAVKYSFDDKVVRIGLGRKKGRLLIDVENFGMLIPESEISHIWDRFYRGMGVVGARQYRPGTGMGLAVVKGLVEELAGTVEVSCQRASSPPTSLGGVVRFIVSLPTKSEEDQT